MVHASFEEACTHSKNSLGFLTIFAGVSGKAVRTQCTREARWRRGAAPDRRVEGVPHRRCCLAGTCRWFKASGPLGSCWLWPRRPLFFGPQPDLGSVGLDIAPVPRERVEAHAAGHPLSGAIHAAFLPMQGVCVAPAPRCQRVWKHRGACQPSPAVVLERPRAAPARRPRVVRARVISHRHQAMMSRSRRGPPGCFEWTQGLRGCIGQLH